MKVNVDENGYVTEWCMVGDNGGAEVEPPEDFDSFLDCFSGFKLVNGELVKDEEKDTADRLELQRDDLRKRREAECFPVINRGWIWYSSLTLSQWRELRTWYLAWLNVTSTLTVPNRPTWLDNVDTSRIPLTPSGIL